MRTLPNVRPQASHELGPGGQKVDRMSRTVIRELGRRLRGYYRDLSEEIPARLKALLDQLRDSERP